MQRNMQHFMHSCIINIFTHAKSAIHYDNKLISVKDNNNSKKLITNKKRNNNNNNKSVKK